MVIHEGVTYNFVLCYWNRNKKFWEELSCSKHAISWVLLVVPQMHNFRNICRKSIVGGCLWNYFMLDFHWKHLVYLLQVWHVCFLCSAWPSWFITRFTIACWGSWKRVFSKWPNGYMDFFERTLTCSDHFENGSDIELLRIVSFLNEVNIIK